jgi:PAS domain S-box-containing protein
MEIIEDIQVGGFFSMSQKPTYEGLEQRIQELKKEAFERKRAEEALEESETRYRRLFETAQDGILILDAGTERIENANPFIVDMLGFSTEEVVGKKLWEIGPFRDIEANQSAFLELREKEYIRYEHLPLETKDGRSITVEFISNVYLVKNKKVIQCNIRDITKRKRAEEALRKSDKKLSIAKRMEAVGFMAAGTALPMI